MERSVLITGGLGFIGTNLVPKLLSRGMKVRILDNFSAANTTANPIPDVKVIKSNIINKDGVANFLPEPISLYGVSKLRGKANCHVFAQSYGLRTFSLTRLVENR